MIFECKGPGLMVMIDLLPRVGSNHDVSDAIAMWLGYCGNGVLRKELIDQAAFAKKNGKAEYCIMSDRCDHDYI